jgi:hypothetical protein
LRYRGDFKLQTSNFQHLSAVPFLFLPFRKKMLGMGAPCAYLVPSFLIVCFDFPTASLLAVGFFVQTRAPAYNLGLALGAADFNAAPGAEFSPSLALFPFFCFFCQLCSVFQTRLLLCFFQK